MDPIRARGQIPDMRQKSPNLQKSWIRMFERRSARLIKQKMICKIRFFMRYRNKFHVYLLLALVMFAGWRVNNQAGAQTRNTSELWGSTGSLWNPTSRLPDYSFAGYRSGEKSIPTPAVVANVKDFGAASNDDSDDSAAFRNALASASSGAVFVPNGTYRLNTPVTINKSNVVLRGESQS